jgi:Flp pilus assembly secretin CpaC
MKRVSLFVLAATLIISGHHAIGGEKQSSDKQVRVNVSIWEGDPLGSEEEGTLKRVAQPTLVTLDGRHSSFMIGGEIVVPDGRKKVRFADHGVKMEVSPVLVDDGKIELTLTLSNTTLDKNTERRIQLHSESTQAIETVKQGEVVKLRLINRPGDKQLWAEVSAQEVTNASD